MPSTYPGSNIYHGSILIPSDGDQAVAESVNVALLGLQDSNVAHQTDIGFKIDSRGGSYGLLGNIFVSGAFEFVLAPATVQIGGVFGSNLLDIRTTHTTVEGTDLTVSAGTTYLVSSETTVGSGATHHMTVNSTVDFYGPISLHNDLTSGHDISCHTLNVDGGVDFDCDAQVTHSGQNLTVGGNSQFDGDVTISGIFRPQGGGHFGNSATDQWEITGNVEFDNNVAVDGTLTIGQNVTMNGSHNDLGTEAVVGTFSTFGDTTIGNSSSDGLTINALLSGALQMGTNGRVLPSSTFIQNSSPTLGLSSARIISATSGGTPMTLTVDDTGMLGGDGFVIFFHTTAGGTLTINIPSALKSTSAITTNSVIWLQRMPGASTQWTITAWPSSISL
jgi:hypothetical protein